ncbi:MAG: hypothetical protein MJE68_12990 [Proteobacteria bacterium]|nr:hypothetical protein [Pseudomonadota bacterium]
MVSEVENAKLYALIKVYWSTITVESRDYAPLMCMLALGKSGEGARRIRVMTITDPRGRAISVFSLAVWWVKLEKKYKIRHNMTQIASLLAAFYSRGGAYTRDKTTYARNSSSKNAGGLRARWGA